MATSSVASLPSKYNPEEQDAPAMLDRARGLASGITGGVGGSRGRAGGATSPLPSNNNMVPRAAAGLDARLEALSSHSSKAMSLSTARTKPPHRHTQSGRISKTRLRPSPTATPSVASPSSLLPPTILNAANKTSAAAAAATVATANAATAATPAASIPYGRSNSSPIIRHSKHHAATASSSSSIHSSSSAATVPLRRSASTSPPDMDAPVLSFWGPEPVPLPSRFARIKQNIIAGHEAELEASWARLIAALRPDVEHIEGLGAHLIPSLEFADLQDEAQTARFGRDLRRYGVGVVRKVMPRADADAVVNDTVDYLDQRRRGGAKAAGGPGVDTRAPIQDPTCFDLFWTPAQVRSRAHPNVLRAQRFMMGLWETSPDDRLATRLPITYVDRIRIHGTGFDRPTGDSNNKDRASGLDSATAPPQSPQSADDWINALQSSAGIIAQVDNGSLERWEPDGYGRGGTYDHVFHGNWEEYDPWECASRVSSTMDLYNGHGACTIFRMFQGLLALSTIEPGMVRLLPSPKLAAAYYMLRPFFTPKKPAPAPGPPRGGPEWEAYLAPENWALQRDPDTIIHGAVPGHAQRITEHWHPHLHLRGSMITLPTLQPGDYICWHPDLPYHISSNNTGLTTPSDPDASDISMLVYIPAAPLTQTNALYLARQRKAFQRGNPGPDFDSSGRGVIVEDPNTRPGEKEIAMAGGAAGLRAMGLAPWEVAETRAGTPLLKGDKARRTGTEDEVMTDADAEARVRGPSPTNTSTSSGAEAEVVRLANLILFPDHSMVGYSV